MFIIIFVHSYENGFRVPTAATTSTVTITTSPATMNTKQWEQHYKLWVPAPQGERRDPLGNGPATVLPATLPGQPFNFSQHDWPRLPLTTGLYSTTVSSITTTSAQGATKAIVDTAQEKVLPVPITKQEKAVHYHEVATAKARVGKTFHLCSQHRRAFYYHRCCC